MMRRTRQALPGLSRYRGLKLNSLRQGLVAYWPLQEVSGTRYDISGRGNHLTDNNTVTQSAGPPRVPWAGQFTRTNSEYLSRADGTDLRFSGDWSLSVWARMDSKPAAFMAAVSKDQNAAPSSREVTLQYRNDVDRFNLLMLGDGGVFVLDDSVLGSPSTGVWYHFFCWRSGTTMGFQINGKAANTMSVSGTVGAAMDINIGRSGNALDQKYWDGQIAHVGKWSRSLTTREAWFIWSRGVAAGVPF